MKSLRQPALNPHFVIGNILITKTEIKTVYIPNIHNLRFSFAGNFRERAHQSSLHPRKHLSPWFWGIFGHLLE